MWSDIFKFKLWDFLVRARCLNSYRLDLHCERSGVVEGGGGGAAVGVGGDLRAEVDLPEAAHADRLAKLPPLKSESFGCGLYLVVSF